MWQMCAKKKSWRRIVVCSWDSFIYYLEPLLQLIFHDSSFMLSALWISAQDKQTILWCLDLLSSTFSLSKSSWRDLYTLVNHFWLWSTLQKKKKKKPQPRTHIHLLIYYIFLLKRCIPIMMITIITSTDKSWVRVWDFRMYFKK